jgi:DNA repair protein RecN (Recombination protein N)
MLRELHISNFAVIEDAAIELREGLNCFTGQTGAGKSLVIGAFEALLGLRAAADLLRQGADEGRVSGIFELKDPHVIRRVNELADLDLDPAAAPEQLLITRKLFSSGRTSFTVSGQPATASMVRALGELLVDVHGQHDHQFLLKPANQLVMIDRFAGCEPQREQFASIHREARDLARRRAELQASQTLRRQQMELYEFQAQEIDDAAPVEGEYEEVSARHRLLSNLERVKREAGGAYSALHDAEGSVVERLHMIVAAMRELGDLDEDLRPIAAVVKDAAAQLQDAAFDLGRYIHRLDLDPAELEEVTDRLNALNRLIHKYGSAAGPGGGLADVLAYRHQIESEITRLRSESEDLATIDNQAAPLRKQLADIGAHLTQARKAAAAKLAPLVEEQLAQLGMAEARLSVAFEPADPDAGESPSGFDSIELLVQPNPGQPARPLRKIASGGELSRVMLALKSIVADADRVSVLVFDEIDANVGGRMGSVIGDKLRRLAAHHQVLCITHLPQIAAFADHHVRIVKSVEAGQTRTRVEAMTERDRRVGELAEMITGSNPTPTTRQQADEMLRLADAPRLSPRGRGRPSPRGRVRGRAKLVNGNKNSLR